MGNHVWFQVRVQDTVDALKAKTGAFCNLKADLIASIVIRPISFSIADACLVPEQLQLCTPALLALVFIYNCGSFLYLSYLGRKHLVLLLFCMVDFLQAVKSPLWT